MQPASAFLAIALLTVGRDGEALAPWATNRRPGDVAKTHVEDIASGDHRYVVVQGGTMDGRNCRSPMGCGMAREGAFIQTWESNRSVRLENVGAADIINPWLSNGRNNFRSAREIVAAAVAPGMTDAEKAFSLWFQETRHRHHSAGDNDELGDPVKVFNVYGYNTCGNDSICLGTLFQLAGLKTAPARAVGHCVTQTHFDGRWHFFDGDLHSVYLLRDNETVAGEQDIVRDHDLVKRTHSQGILVPASRSRDQGMASLYCYQGEVTGSRSGKSETTMNMTLRPGEAIVWRWGHTVPVKYHGTPGVGPVYPDAVCNGLWEYRPDFSSNAWRRGAVSVDNVVEAPDGLAGEAGKSGVITWKMQSPYVFVGGRLDIDGQGVAAFLSTDGKTWKPAANALDPFFPSDGPARYEYQLQIKLDGAARLKRLAIVNDIQMAPLALPEMAIGSNAFRYTDESQSERRVRVTHEWVERSESRAPAAPKAPIAPPNMGESSGTDVAFAWTPAADPDGDVIADYHFELSPRPDMKWPLSMSFYRLISRVDGVQRSKERPSGKDLVSASYRLLQPGLLSPGRTYYWRVRAQDDKGVWGPWSETWSFVPRGPNYPLDAIVAFDEVQGRGVLTWRPNLVGSRPARYRVYASDEKGFSISDEPYDVNVGINKDLPPRFGANFVAETSACELPVVGIDVTNPAANKTYYRVVAVDESGRRSGPSDLAEAPRPVIYSRPETAATAGREYRYEVKATRSLGTLGLRIVDGREVQNFWDIEKPEYAIERGPAWLKIDPATGLLSGTPDRATNAEVVVSATNRRQVRMLDESALKWGIEKVVATKTETLGHFTQKFGITVRE